jgi:hypothetical protein
MARAQTLPAQAFLLGTPFIPLFYDKRRGFCLGKIFLSAGHSSHPADGLAEAGIFAISFRLKFLRTPSASQMARAFAAFLACYFRVRIFSSKCERKF